MFYARPHYGGAAPRIKYFLKKRMIRTQGRSVATGKKCATVLKFHYRITRYALADVTKRCINPRTSVQRFNESEEKGALNWDTRAWIGGRKARGEEEEEEEEGGGGDEAKRSRCKKTV